MIAEKYLFRAFSPNDNNLKLQLLQVQMAHLRFILLFIAVAVFYTCAAQDDDDSGNAFQDKECTISKPGSDKYKMYMRGFFRGRLVYYKKFKKDANEARWTITPVRMGGKTYFEFINRDTKSVMGFRRGQILTGNFKPYKSSSSTVTLFSLNPPRPANNVVIESVSKRGRFITRPSSSNDIGLQLERTKSAWTIKCD
jgi:hypothetical protein